MEEEFGRQRTPTVSGVERDEHEQGQAARETPAKATRMVPLEFMDDATGEVLDVIQDDEPNSAAQQAEHFAQMFKPHRQAESDKRWRSPVQTTQHWR